MRFGVVRFPGTCDDRDALQAARRVGEAVILWHRDRDLRGVDAVIVPGGFSYGDYLRVGAIARFSPVMEEIDRFARHGGLVLGICNGFQVLCEAGLLPGALLPEHVAALRLPPGRARRRERGHAVDAGVRTRRQAVHPGQAHDGPLLGARPRARRAGGRRQVVLRYAPGQASTARRARSRGCATRRATSSG